MGTLTELKATVPVQMNISFYGRKDLDLKAAKI